MRYAYMVDKTRSLEIVFSAESLASLLQRTAFLSRVLRQDRRLIEEVTARRAEVKETMVRLQEQKAELDLLESEKQKEEHYTAMKEEAPADLDAVRDQKAANEAAAKELEQASARMVQVLADLDRRRQMALQKKDPVLAELDLQDFGANRGRLPWPVQGQVVTPFGRQMHPKYKTVTVSNGLDIAAPEGSAVLSVGPGIVDLVQWLPGYGETVIVNHGRGITRCTATSPRCRCARRPRGSRACAGRWGHGEPEACLTSRSAKAGARRIPALAPLIYRLLADLVFSFTSHSCSSSS
jgi:septal ring factor EnvC (AmiA/AmiB activator)